jgi:hypothetical protein
LKIELNSMIQKFHSWEHIKENERLCQHNNGLYIFLATLLIIANQDVDIAQGPSIDEWINAM